MWLVAGAGIVVGIVIGGVVIAVEIGIGIARVGVVGIGKIAVEGRK